VNARSALFDVYGDHLLSRGGQAPVASLVAMMAALDIAPPAVRTAISRMVSQRWLVSVRLPEGAGYALTERAEHRLGEAAARIYRTGNPPWDHSWHLLSLERIAERARRERVRNGLGYLGYAPLRDDTWISPRRSDEVDALLKADDVHATGFVAEHDGDDAVLAAATWDLAGLGASYRRWLAEARDLVEGRAASDDDRAAFVTRSRLVHEWRKFLFLDPGLPRELLPDAWPGDAAAAYFDTEARRLLPAAGRYVDACLQAPSAANGGD
jgi:phenylacetic acid degradation operon negative regulatory protein